ncbi:MAG: hypothetical protein GQ535_08670 [Rhodobacteraceae bacterium]|nr:hypothetical protein [Paracoccaceae bacterium]
MATSQKNFIIQYNGREGSSAIISALSAQKGVNVPLFEELDKHNFENTNTPKDYPQALNDILSTGVFSGQRKLSGKVQPPNPDEKVLTTGFKWRITGNIRDIAKIMQHYNVNVFLLLRRDFLNMTCSAYVHRFGNRLQSNIEMPTHPQFTGNKDGAETLQKLERINQQEFNMVKSLFLRSAYNVAATRKRQVGKARQLARAGIPVRLIYYEDFDGRQQEFITSFLEKIGVDISETYIPYCGFSKVHKNPISERIEGLDRMANSRLFKYFKQDYEDAVKVMGQYTQP